MDKIFISLDNLKIKFHFHNQKSIMDFAFLSKKQMNWNLKKVKPRKSEFEPKQILWLLVKTKSSRPIYSADLPYLDKTNKTWIFKHVFLKLG